MKHLGLITALILIAIGAIMVFQGVVQLNNTRVNYNTEIKNAETTLLNNNIFAVEASYNSPKITIKLQSFDALLLKAKQLNATEVYKISENKFVAIDNDFKFAWSYSIPYDFGFMWFIEIMVGVFLIGGTIWIGSLILSGDC